MNDLVLPDTASQTIFGLLRKYRADLSEATTATASAVQQLRQQLTNMERNQVAILAQKALLDTFEKELAAAGISEPSTQQANAPTTQST
ncbi:hypothetical protein EKK58_00180 [Candidatus Dependentiae bacterium]|nr:MAG: hypothetical protein EKK58_00180 [Candidatus Dependentiae bacterium]